MSYGKKVRQVGTQEVNILDIVKPLTKYSSLIKDKRNLLKELNKALKIAISDRPGPVWLDIPLELQWSDIQVNKKDVRKILPKKEPAFEKGKIITLSKLIKKSQKPLFIVGYGAYLSKSEKKKNKKVYN